MGLVLGVSKGDKLYFNDTEAEITSVSGYDRIDLTVEGKNFIISNDKTVQILPDVKVQAGRPVRHKSVISARLLIHAPPRVVVLREELYLKRRTA